MCWAVRSWLSQLWGVSHVCFVGLIHEGGWFGTLGVSTDPQKDCCKTSFLNTCLILGHFCSVLPFKKNCTLFVWITGVKAQPSLMNVRKKSIFSLPSQIALRLMDVSCLSVLLQCIYDLKQYYYYCSNTDHISRKCWLPVSVTLALARLLGTAYISCR